MKILVCGFMGSGKTTFVEKFRANQLGFRIIDLDQWISPQTGEWIRAHGLEAFRQKEVESLKSLLAGDEPMIIAVGGGTIEAPGFWELARDCQLIFLDVPFSVCYSRIKNDPNRPLAELGEAGLLSLYQKRLPIYQRANLILSEAGIKEIVGLDRLVHNLRVTF